LPCLQALDQHGSEGIVSAGWVTVGEYEHGPHSHGVQMPPNRPPDSVGKTR
jgi:hypothetical protein